MKSSSLVARVKAYFANQEKFENKLLSDESVSSNTELIKNCPARRRVSIHGVVNEVLYRPKGETPVFVAVLKDGTGKVELVFLGRREVKGVEPGVHLSAEGCFQEIRGNKTIINPKINIVAQRDER